MNNTMCLRFSAIVMYWVQSLLFEPPVHGQGTVFFSNLGAPGAIIDGLTGVRAESGTMFSVALYFASDGIIDESQYWQLGASVNIGVLTGVAHDQLAGIFIGNGRTAPVTPPGGFGMFQVRAWETRYGATYESAVANRNLQNGRLALAGESGIMRVNTSDPTIPDPDVPASLIDPVSAVSVIGAPLRDGFVLSVVPEPSTWALLSIGAGSLMWALRRQRPR